MRAEHDEIFSETFSAFIESGTRGGGGGKYIVVRRRESVLEILKLFDFSFDFNF